MPIPFHLRCRLSICAVLGLSAQAAFAETPGKDGDFTVSGSNVVVNEYSQVAGALSPGQSSVSVSSVAGDLPSLSPGDLILIYQAQGATIDQSDTAGYGAVTNLGNAGRYEFQTVASISGNTITFETYNSTCNGLSYAYDAAEAQVIRVPQYATLGVPSGTSLTARAWNGATGGVLAVHVQGATTLNGTISVNARGFRGGAVDNLTTASTSTTKANGYRSSAAAYGAEKGESIAGYQADYTTGRYGRGAPANGGGGGNAHNAGGGGGANGDNSVSWTGQGNPDLSTASWTQAWDIDGAITSTSTSSGGGRGGYTYGRDGDALTRPPGDAGWGGDSRRNVGGLGGRPLAFQASGRLYFGGGGGAGDGNNSSAGAGGRGGGLAMLLTDSLSGSGLLRANGQAGRSTTPSHNDAPGGGGGGGTVFVKSSNISGIRLRANGARGGSQLITNTENEGPGGGGGGGVIAFENGTPSARTFAGANGTTTAPSMDEFIPNGATRGALGQPNESAPSDAALPFCRRPKTVLSGSKSVTVWDPLNAGRYALPGEDVLYTISVTNPGGEPVDAGTIVLTDSMPAELAFRNAPLGGPDPVEFVDSGSGLSCCTGAEVAYSDTTVGAPVYGYTPDPGPDLNVRYIRVTPDGEMAPFSSFSIRFRAKIQ